MAFCYLELDKITEALELANQVKKLSNEIDDLYFYCTALNQTANVYLKCGDFKNAEEVSSNIIEIAGIDSDEEDDEIFATHIYQRQEKHWKDLFVLLNGFKDDKNLS